MRGALIHIIPSFSPLRTRRPQSKNEPNNIHIPSSWRHDHECGEKIKHRDSSRTLNKKSWDSSTELPRRGESRSTHVRSNSADPKSNKYLAATVEEGRRRGIPAHFRRSPAVPRPFPSRSPAGPAETRQGGGSGSGGSLPLRDKSTAPHAFSSSLALGPCLLLRVPLPFSLSLPPISRNSSLLHTKSPPLRTLFLVTHSLVLVAHRFVRLSAVGKELGRVQQGRVCCSGRLPRSRGVY